MDWRDVETGCEDVSGVDEQFTSHRQRKQNRFSFFAINFGSNTCHVFAGTLERNKKKDRLGRNKTVHLIPTSHLIFHASRSLRRNVRMVPYFHKHYACSNFFHNKIVKEPFPCTRSIPQGEAKVTHYLVPKFHFDTNRLKCDSLHKTVPVGGQDSTKQAKMRNKEILMKNKFMSYSDPLDSVAPLHFMNRSCNSIQPYENCKQKMKYCA